MGLFDGITAAVIGAGMATAANRLGVAPPSPPA
jgi:hypothetical protein